MTPAARCLLLALFEWLFGPGCEARQSAPAPAVVIDIPPAITASSAPAIREAREPAAHPATGPLRPCGRDRYRSFSCGHVAGRTGGEPCPASPSQVYSELAFPLGWPSEPPHDHYDATLTRAYRAAFPADPGEPPSCCYSDCVAAGVRAQPDVAPAGWPLRVLCITAMSATSAPAAADPSCPRALLLPGGPHGSFAGAFDPGNSGPPPDDREARLVSHQCCYLGPEGPQL